MNGKLDNINVRLEHDLKARAESVASNCGTNLSMVIRMLLERLVDHAEQHGGRVVMPPEFVDYDIRPKPHN
jgi:predicted DNA-binding protein